MNKLTIGTFLNKMAIIVHADKKITAWKLNY
jgi:hypothetical protein